MSEDSKITLISSDDIRFEVPKRVARMSKVIADQIGEDDDDDEGDFPCPKVPGDILKKVVDYCTHYQTEEMVKIETPLQGETVQEIVKPAWYAEFCVVEREVLFQLVAAANFLNIKPLLDLTCLAVSVSIKGKSVEELRQIFNLPAPAADGAGSADAKDSDDDQDMEP